MTWFDCRRVGNRNAERWGTRRQPLGKPLFSFICLLLSFPFVNWKVLFASILLMNFIPISLIIKAVSIWYRKPLLDRRTLRSLCVTCESRLRWKWTGTRFGPCCFGGGKSLLAWRGEIFKNSLLIPMKSGRPFLCFMNRTYTAMGQ